MGQGHLKVTLGYSWSGLSLYFPSGHFSVPIRNTELSVAPVYIFLPPPVLLFCHYFCPDHPRFPHLVVSTHSLNFSLDIVSRTTLLRLSLASSLSTDRTGNQVDVSLAGKENGDSYGGCWNWEFYQLGAWEPLSVSGQKGDKHSPLLWKSWASCFNRFYYYLGQKMTAIEKNSCCFSQFPWGKGTTSRERGAHRKVLGWSGGSEGKTVGKSLYCSFCGKE